MITSFKAHQYIVFNSVFLSRVFYGSHRVQEKIPHSLHSLHSTPHDANSIAQCSAFVPARNRLNAGLPEATHVHQWVKTRMALSAATAAESQTSRSKATINSSGRFPSGVLTWAGPQPDTEEEEGSALDFPEVRSAEAARLHEILRLNAFLKISLSQEYVRAVPSRRPDIFPDLKDPKQPMPKPMPGDPEVPDEEEEEEEEEAREPGTNPDGDEGEERSNQRRGGGGVRRNAPKYM